MLDRVLILYGLASLCVMALFADSASAQLASIRAQATVVKPVGISLVETSSNDTGIDTLLSIRKPESSCLLCHIEADGELLEEFVIQDEGDIFLTSMITEILSGKSDSGPGTIVITITCSEN